MPGLTAYVGLLDIAALRDGDVVFVSGAAGAVGSLAGQIAKLRGHTVIGSAGSPEKVAHVLDDLGFDAAFDYHDGPSASSCARPRRTASTSTSTTSAASTSRRRSATLNTYGRVAMCGAISTYNATELPPGPRNLFQAVAKRLTLRGYIILDHERPPRRLRAQEVGAWVARRAA